MSVKIYFLGFLLVLGYAVSAQRSIVFGTYGAAPFMQCPGVEYSFKAWKSFNLQTGVSTYLLNADPNRIANISNTRRFNFLSANIGVQREVLQKGRHQMGVIVGGIAYHGPRFRVLHETEDPGSTIYYDASHLYTLIGLDLGFTYSYDRWSIVAKFDSSRKILRWGLGFRLGSTPSK